MGFLYTASKVYKESVVEDRIVNEDWQAFLRMLPANWRELAKETSALTRKPKNFKDEETIMRLFFLHTGNSNARKNRRYSKYNGRCPIKTIKKS